MTTPVFFPKVLCRERTLEWTLGAKTISSGQTGLDALPLARTDGGGLWSAALSSVALTTADLVRCWRALDMLADAGAQPIVMPNIDRVFAPWPIVNGKPLRSYGDVHHSDTSPFSDGSGYYQPVIAAKLTTAAALRATTLTIAISYGSALRGGEHFSIEGPIYSFRMYRVRTAVYNGDGTATITIRPPLREAATANTVLDFDRPKCVMRLAQSDAMRLGLELRRYGTPNAAFVETFDIP